MPNYASGNSALDEMIRKQREDRKKKEETVSSQALEAAPERAPASATSKASAAGVDTLAQGGSATDAASSALMSSGSPHAMAAGLGLKALSGAKKEREAKKEKKRAEVLDALGQFRGAVV